MSEKSLIGRKIEIIQVNANGPQFANLTPGSVHEVIEPPLGGMNDVSGVWVMGVNEPVLVLFREYEYLEEEK
jgi:hypothetical protein